MESGDDPAAVIEGLRKDIPGLGKRIFDFYRQEVCEGGVPVFTIGRTRIGISAVEYTYEQKGKKRTVRLAGRLFAEWEYPRELDVQLGVGVRPHGSTAPYEIPL